MDDLLNKPAIQSPSQPNLDSGLADQVESLRQLAISVMVLVLVIGGAFDLFLLRQVKYANQELSAIRPQAEQVISDWQKFRQPLMDGFIKQIVQYGQTHPDFGPILTKYNLKPAGSAAPSPSTPAPVSNLSSPALKK